MVPNGSTLSYMCPPNFRVHSVVRPCSPQVDVRVSPVVTSVGSTMPGVEEPFCVGQWRNCCAAPEINCPSPLCLLCRRESVSASAPFGWCPEAGYPVLGGRLGLDPAAPALGLQTPDASAQVEIPAATPDCARRWPSS